MARSQITSARHPSSATTGRKKRSWRCSASTPAVGSRCSTTTITSWGSFTPTICCGRSRSRPVRRSTSLPRGPKRRVSWTVRWPKSGASPSSKSRWARTGARVISNEVIVGANNGLITGVVVAIIAALVSQNPMFGGILAVSMVLNLVVAGFFGAIIPMIFEKMNFDPATSATIFITTATDVLGFFFFRGLAAVLII
ncbi:MAG: magnesium transporter [Bradymonadaceae bacterium]